MVKKFEEFKRVNQWDLPEIIDPDRICVCFEIPNERYHIRAFWTALYKLALWNSWETDPTHKGTQVASVWREVLNKAREDENTMGCGCNQPTNQRYGEDGILEVSYDGGQTWEDAPQLDPRFNAPLAPPLDAVSGTQMRCESATNATAFLKAMADDLIADAALWSGLTAIVAAILAIMAVIGIFASGGTLSPLLLGLVAALLSTGQAAFDAAMTGTVYDDLNCILYCHCPDDGTYTETAWQEIKAEIAGTIAGIAGTFLHDTINSFGPAGLNNAARSRLGTSPDCAGCDCGCGEGCTFAWEGVQYTTKTPAVFGDWTFSGADCDASTYRCFTTGNYIQLGSLAGVCVNQLRYSIARIGAAQTVITVNGTDTYTDAMSGMATNGSAQVQRVFNFPQPIEITTIRFQCLGGTAVYIREVEFSECEA